jgi:predicted ATPase
MTIKELQVLDLNDHNSFFVVTGGPGSGKTALVDALERAGYARTVEAGRAIIQEQVAIGGAALPWSDQAMFAELMLSWEMRSYQIARRQVGRVFFDRGVPDVVGYLRLTGSPLPGHVAKAVEIFRYNQPSSLLRPGVRFSNGTTSGSKPLRKLCGRMKHWPRPTSVTATG